jgi:hypothetical protein
VTSHGTADLASRRAAGGPDGCLHSRVRAPLGTGGRTMHLTAQASHSTDGHPTVRVVSEPGAMQPVTSVAYLRRSPRDLAEMLSTARVTYEAASYAGWHTPIR